MAELLKTWKKNQFIPYVNIAMPTSAVPNPEPDWARIGKSTVFDLVFNSNVVTYDFIENENPTDIISNYKPTLSQELRTVRGDKAFDALYEYTYNLPTGDEAYRDMLLVFPSMQAAATETESAAYHAWKVSCSLVPTNLNTVDEKILFTLNFAADIVRGYVKSANGQPEFTPFTDQSAWVNTADLAVQENP